MDDIQRTIDYFKNKLQSGISKGRKKQYENAVSAMEELQQYREIGTPEECRAAREKQQVKEPKVKKNKHSDAYLCPQCCKRLISKDETGWFAGQCYKYCPDCGQAIDWKEE